MSARTDAPRRHVAGRWIAVLGLVLAASCTEKHSIENVEWLAGVWEGTTSSGATFYESWRKTGETTLLGSGFRVVDGDTVFGEKLRIEENDGSVFYVAEVGHNDGEVAFELVEVSDTYVTFENPEHDFPQRFIYRLRPDGTLYIRAESIANPSEKLEFVLSRNG